MKPNSGSPARLVLIRHGETVGNRQNLWTGWTDTPLSEAGWAQVRRTARRLEGDPLNAVALYTSPIGRAQGTADIIGRALDLSPISDEALKEMHFGDLEAIDGARFADEHPELYAHWRDRLDESFGLDACVCRRSAVPDATVAVAGIAGLAVAAGWAVADTAAAVEATRPRAVRTGRLAPAAAEPVAAAA